MKGKNVIVTGASSGLGAHITRRLVGEGANVVAVARRTHRLRALSDELEDADGRIAPTTADVTDPDDITRVVSTTLDEFGSIDALVNNAGMEIQGAIDALDPKDFETMWTTNVAGPFLFIRAAVPHLRESRGTVINIGSTVVSRPPMNRFGYVASKGAVEAMSMALAGDLGPNGIRVNVVRPGIVPSELRGASEDEEKVALSTRVPGLQALEAVGDGTDVAAAVAYLISEDGRWITGTVLDVDGGYSLGVIR